jgi:hypothetical protein
MSRRSNRKACRLEVVGRVQTSTIEVLRRHATLVIVARSVAPLPRPRPSLGSR